MTDGSNALKALQKYLDALPGKTALVIGDVMLDRFVYGAVNRMSPESDSPVLDIRRETAMAGGAANVAANLKGLGLKTILLGVIGEDEGGKTLLDLVQDNADLLIAPGRPTTVKTRFVSAGGQLLRADNETRQDIDAVLQKRVLERITAIVPGCDAVILSDYNKGVLTPAVIRETIRLAQSHNVPILVDPKKDDYGLYKGASLLTPNRKELAAATGMAVGSDNEVMQAAHKLMDDFGFAQIVVTRSEDGMSAFKKDAAPYHSASKATEVIDVAGAGDAAIAGLAAGLAAGAGIEEAVELANHACGIAVAREGTCRVSAAELRGALDGKAVVKAQPDYTREAPLCSWGEAADIIARWQQDGLKIGFTNGCFDILHYGHVNYLNRARDKCDRLVIGLNHDASIKILKGPERPLHDGRSRASVIGALGAVDLVILFGAEQTGEDNTPCALIEHIKPNIYFKGGDYTIDQLPEAKVMARLGGVTDIMPLYEGHSTTATLNKMKGAA